MALTDNEILQRLGELTEPGIRERLLARGMARSLLWREGRIPPDARPFAASLSYDLESHAFLILQLALSISNEQRFQPIVLESYRVAADSIEAVIRRGDPQDEDRSFLTIIAAAAYQLARLGARSYVVLPANLDLLPLSLAEKLLGALLRRDFGMLTALLLHWIERAGSDAVSIGKELSAEESPDTQIDDPGPIIDKAIAWILSDNYVRAISHLDLAIRFLDIGCLEESKSKLDEGITVSGEAHHVPLWWIYTLTRSIIDDLWGTLIWNCLPTLDGDSPAGAEWNGLREKYIYRKITKQRPEIDVWPSQLDATRRAPNHADNLVIALPTSAGKTKIAELCILRCLSLGRRVFYITPLRALSAQIERILAASFGPLGFAVSSLYGASGVSKVDVEIARTEQIIVATPEKLDYVLRTAPETLDDVGLIVLDEGHMIGFGVREIRYETLVQRLLKRADADMRRIVCLSAIFDSGESFDDFVSWVSSGDPKAFIHSNWRPTRQRAAVCYWDNSSATLQFFVEEENPFVEKYITRRDVKGRRTRKLPCNKNELVVALTERLIGEGHTVLVYCPTRRSVNTVAEVFLDLINRGAVRLQAEQCEDLDIAVNVGCEWLGKSHIAVQCLQKGVALHHGALPRPFLSEIEKLINSRRIRAVVASPTLAQGLDLSCSALVFQSLFRSGEQIPPHEFRNVIGRVGRAFVDTEGISIFPVYEDTERRTTYRIRQFLAAWQDEGARQLESGLLKLVALIISSLAARLEMTPAEVIERVSAVDFDWDGVAKTSTTDDRSAQVEADMEQVDLLRLVAQLDEALLTILNPDTEASALAEALDQCLKDSYWERRLKRLGDTAEYQRQRQLMLRRARWIWSRSNNAARRGFAAAGIGFSAGAKLINAIATLAPQLTSAETALLEGRIDDALESLVLLLEFLFSTPPFDTAMPDQWQLYLQQWITGKPIWGKQEAAVEEGLEFIADGVVYRAVWGLEAIRSTALSMGLIDESFTARVLSETLTLAMTHLKGIDCTGLSKKCSISRTKSVCGARLCL